MTSSRRLRRFFSSLPLPQKLQQTVYLPFAETNHLRNILRFKEGDFCLITDGTGREVEAVIQRFMSDGSTQLRVTKMVPVKNSEFCLSLRVLQALVPKGKMEDVIEKSQEFGVEMFWPIESERSVFKLTQESRAKLVSRWNKKAMEAAKQSGSLKLMQIESPASLQQALKKIPAQESLLIFHTAKQTVSFRDWLNRYASRNDRPTLNLLFGPEGGFSEKEIEWILNSRNNSKDLTYVIDLGSNVLRVETAVIGVIATLRFVFS